MLIFHDYVLSNESTSFIFCDFFFFLQIALQSITFVAEMLAAKMSVAKMFMGKSSRIFYLLFQFILLIEWLT